ncbi:MAG: NADH-quinone oxidoreductase subunit L, partial [Thiohalocapsa sp.]
WATIEPLLISNWLGDAIFVKPEHDTLHYLAEHWHGQVAFILHGMTALPFWLAMGGLALATYVWWLLYRRNPDIDVELQRRAQPLTGILENKYGFDDFNQKVFAGGGRGIGQLLWLSGDRTLIDGMVVNGSARLVGVFAGIVRHLQTGYLYHYAIAMILGLVALLTIFVAL